MREEVRGSSRVADVNEQGTNQATDEQQQYLDHPETHLIGEYKKRRVRYKTYASGEQILLSLETLLHMANATDLDKLACRNATNQDTHCHDDRSEPMYFSKDGEYHGIEPYNLVNSKTDESTLLPTPPPRPEIAM